MCLIYSAWEGKKFSMDTNNAKTFLSRRVATPMWVLLGVGTLTLCMGCSLMGRLVGASDNGSGAPAITSTSTSAQSHTSTSKPATPKPTPKPTQAPTWQVVQTFSGNGTENTANFNPGSDTWKLVWSCDPTSFDGMNYNVMVAVENQDGSDADPEAVNTLCSSGNNSGETIERNMNGTYYLSVNSEAAWTVKIEVLK